MTISILLFGITMLSMEIRMEQVQLFRRHLAAEADNAASAMLLMVDEEPEGGSLTEAAAKEVVERQIRDVFPKEAETGKLKITIQYRGGKKPEASVRICRGRLVAGSRYRLEQAGIHRISCFAAP